MGKAARRSDPEKTPKRPKWANSILHRNHAVRCTYDGHVIGRATWFKTRQDNGIVLVFCNPEEEAKYDARFKEMHE